MQFSSAQVRAAHLSQALQDPDVPHSKITEIMVLVIPIVALFVSIAGGPGVLALAGFALGAGLTFILRTPMPLDAEETTERVGEPLPER